MKKKIKKVLFKIQGSKIAHFLVPLLWGPVHALIYNKAFNKSYSGGRCYSPFKFFDSTLETEAFVQEFKTYIKSSDLLVRAKEQMLLRSDLSSYVRDIFPELPVRLRAAAYRMALNDIDIRGKVAMYFGLCRDCMTLAYFTIFQLKAYQKRAPSSGIVTQEIVTLKI